MNPKLLYYDCIREFNRQYFKDLLTQEHLLSGEVHIDKLKMPDGGVDDNANVWGYLFEKDGVKYILPNETNSGKGINIRNTLPIFISNLEKVSYRGNVYWYINKIIKATFKAEKKIGFKELVDTISCLSHSNPIHRKMNFFLGLTSMMDRAYFRIASNPGFGKDSVVDTCGSLFGNAATIENPTIAKLEYMTMFKWLAISEVVDIKKEDWRVIEQFLLNAGAYKPEITKHSRAKAGVKEILDVSKFSLALLYNDINDYPSRETYFDFVTKKAVIDRFPAFRFSGKVTEDFNLLKNDDIKKMVAGNMDFYRDLILSFNYYKNNLFTERHNYNTNKLMNLPHRWHLSVGKLLRIIDLYCDSQEEFDKWVDIVNESILSYASMIGQRKTENVQHALW